ncbi:type II toxin-antitoxin system HicB family antitoxin [Methylobacterium sp. WSM2598]|uniref:type II toxin-antitoxin system HicB family antitoxin n=1 Tax=Methylobacterium sp. WSM2598 TaxID=398261 RepID=UPI0003681EF8|nr:type II toxin-antitoxin system HicB family antitoxin [Methylobacterium sp. WSM2598]
MARVVMLVHEDRGVFGASFPDFPGATTVANSIDELFVKAPEMLAFHVEGMVQDGDAVPDLRGVEQLRRDPAFREDAEGAVLAFVDVDLPSKAVRVNISVDEGMLRRIDRAAEAAGETRSGFLVAAAKARLAQLGSS